MRTLEIIIGFRGKLLICAYQTFVLVTVFILAGCTTSSESVPDVNCNRVECLGSQTIGYLYMVSVFPTYTDTAVLFDPDFFISHDLCRNRSMAAHMKALGFQLTAVSDTGVFYVGGNAPRLHRAEISEEYMTSEGIRVRNWYTDSLTLGMVHIEELDLDSCLVSGEIEVTASFKEHPNDPHNPDSLVTAFGSFRVPFVPTFLK